MAEEELTDEELQASKEHVLAIIGDLVSSLLYYDRKEDEDLPRGRIELLVERGILTPEEIAAEFAAQILGSFDKDDVKTPP